MEAALRVTLALRLGDPMDPGTDVGPLVSRDRLDRVRDLVDEAVAGGATLHCGGPVSPPGLPGPYFARTASGSARRSNAAFVDRDVSNENALRCCSV